MNGVAAIIKIGQVITALGPLTADLALKIQHALQPLGPDVQVNIKALADDAIAADEDTIKKVDEFVKSNS